VRPLIERGCSRRESDIGTVGLLLGGRPLVGPSAWRVTSHPLATAYGRRKASWLMQANRCRKTASAFDYIATALCRVCAASARQL
jgi:hypothetical protein